MLLGTRKFTKRQDYVPLQIGNTALENVDTFRYLGVTLDNELKFNMHAANVIKMSSY